MRYLLDVNSLVALAVLDHEFHSRVANWVRGLGEKSLPDLATCSITEVGFVRVLGQAQQYGCSVSKARELLLGLKNSKEIRCTFLPDGRDISHLPKWVKGPKQITDGHLADLAKANDGLLATLDRRIPGGYLIPPGHPSKSQSE